MYLLYSPSIDPFFQQEIAGLAATSIAAMLALLALVYMAAQFFKKPEYESFVSLELYQLFVSLFLFIFVFGAAYFASEMADAFAGSDTFQIGEEYLGFVTNDYALPAVISLETIKLNSQFFGSWTMRWGASVWGVVIPAFPSFVVIERVVDFVLLFISPFTASLMVQMIILEVIRGTALPFVLPAGVVLRIFPFGRDAGAFLIASAMGFGIIYPFTYAMHMQTVNLMIANNQLDPDTLGTVLMQHPTLGDFVSESGFFSVGHIMDVFDMVSYLLLAALFLPALSITLTIAFIKGTAKFISQKLT